MEKKTKCRKCRRIIDLVELLPSLSKNKWGWRHFDREGKAFYRDAKCSGATPPLSSPFLKDGVWCICGHRKKDHRRKHHDSEEWICLKCEHSKKKRNVM